MSEFFLELFSEEMPNKLQVSARDELLKNIVHFLSREGVNHDKNYKAFSTPNRLVIYFKNIENQILKKSREVKGPSVLSTDEALKGFINSNKISMKNIFKKKTENGEFFFYKTKSQKIQTKILLEKNIPSLLSQIKWKKSMKWGNYDLHWGRPLKSIMSIYAGKTLNFKFFHLKNSNNTFINKDYEEGIKSFHNFKSYIGYFKKMGILIDHIERKKLIEKSLLKSSNKKNFVMVIKDKLIDEVTNLVEKPKVILCSFNERFLKMPDELLTTTIEYHQKYFLVYDKNRKLSNNFYIVADCEDKYGQIKLGNEKVIESRLRDAEYFWEKNKSINLIKQVVKLKDINYFNGLGSYFDKAQRLKKLSGLISDELLISKEKVEVASTICKVDLLSNLVNEFPELQGVLGGYFAEEQGFEKEVCLSIKEQYLPSSSNGIIPKNDYSIAISLSDKIDTLVGFFGLKILPSSSKDPYGLRRLTIGLIRIIIENKKTLKLNEIINYSKQLYNNQSIDFKNKNFFDDLNIFIVDRFKNFMKEKGIRNDIIESSLVGNKIDNLQIIFSKANKLNKIINKQLGADLIENYKRAFNIINSEDKFKSNTNLSSADPALFKNDYEKNLFKKIHNVRKDFISIRLENDYDSQLNLLASIKSEISNFFDNVVVNDDDKAIKENRLKLLNMVCETFDNYFSFSKIETTT